MGGAKARFTAMQMLRQRIGRPPAPPIRKNSKPDHGIGFVIKHADEWNAPAFDPNFKVKPIENFEPVMQKTFHNKPVAIN